jgi:hypothetical protein
MPAEHRQSGALEQQQRAGTCTANISADEQAKKGHHLRMHSMLIRARNEESFPPTNQCDAHVQDERHKHNLWQLVPLLIYVDVKQATSLETRDNKPPRSQPCSGHVMRKANQQSRCILAPRTRRPAADSQLHLRNSSTVTACTIAQTRIAEQQQAM